MAFGKRTESRYDSYREKVQKLYETALFGAVLDSCNAILEEATVLMDNSPRSGRIYRRGGVVHKASGPGEPPAPDTGRLKQSGKVVGPTKYPTKILGQVSWSAKYGSFLEFGTVKMAARPFARPALKNTEPDVRRNFEDVAREMRSKK